MGDDEFNFGGQRTNTFGGAKQLTIIQSAATYHQNNQVFKCKNCSRPIDGPKIDRNTGDKYLLCDNCFRDVFGGSGTGGTSPSSDNDNRSCYEKLAKKCGQDDKFEMSSEIWICLLCLVVSLICMIIGIVFINQNYYISIILFGLIFVYFLSGLFTCFKYYGIGRTCYFLFCCWVCCEEELEPTYETEKVNKVKIDYEEHQRQLEEEEQKRNGTWKPKNDNNNNNNNDNDNDSDSDDADILNDEMDLEAPTEAAPVPK